MGQMMYIALAAVLGGVLLFATGRWRVVFAIFAIRRRQMTIERLGFAVRSRPDVERVNGTARGQQTRLARRTRNASRLAERLQWALWLCRDICNWMRAHGSLSGQSPAMALGLADEVWTVGRYINYPVHVSALQRDIWAEEREELLTSALAAQNPKKALPTS